MERRPNGAGSGGSEWGDRLVPGGHLPCVWQQRLLGDRVGRREILIPGGCRGFRGKVRQLAWSMAQMAGAPLLASSSGESVVVWTKDRDPAVGWYPEILDAHQGLVRAIAFQPQSLLLASAAEDGCLYLWKKGRHLAQMLQDVPVEFSCLAWDMGGGAIAAGDSQGNVLVWAKTIAGKGFGWMKYPFIN